MGDGKQSMAVLKCTTLQFQELQIKTSSFSIKAAWHIQDNTDILSDMNTKDKQTKQNNEKHNKKKQKTCPYILTHPTAHARKTTTVSNF